MITKKEIKNLAAENNYYEFGDAVPAYEEGFFAGFTHPKAKEYREEKFLIHPLKNAIPIQVKPSEKPKQFEYYIETIQHMPPEDEKRFLNGMGRSGWELVTVDKQYRQTSFYFKRERLEPEESITFNKKALGRKSNP